MQSHDLIFDIGAHKGEDTGFYLNKGFRVVAVEAAAEFCKLIEQEYSDFVARGQLTILNSAIGLKAGPMDFYVNEDVSVWGTANAEWVERNRMMGAGRVKKITVNAITLADIVDRFGTPRYCKIDIEGNDMIALRSFSRETSPQFISIESEKVSFSKLVEEFRTFESLGYRKYKIIDQSLIELLREPSPAKEGMFLDFRFKEGSSGLFGDDLPGTWLSAMEAIEVYKNIFRGYAINGDVGLFTGSRKSPFYWLSGIQKKAFRLTGLTSYENPIRIFPPAGWYDTHASKA